MNSENWNASCFNLANAYCDSGNKDTNNIKTARGVVAKCMYDMSKCMSKTRDESQYVLCGGKLTRNSYGTPAKCSINEISLQDIVLDKVDEVDMCTDCDKAKKSKSFTWKQVIDNYKKRDKEYDNLNLYNFVVKHWKKKKETIPQFFGYNNYPSWPLTEDYSKCTLTIYQPWRNNVSDLKVDGSYAKALEQFMTNKMFPGSIFHEIMRMKVQTYKDGQPDDAEGDEFFKGKTASTPTKENDRTDTKLEQTVEMNEMNEVSDEVAEAEYSIKMEDVFQLLQKHKDFKWNTNYNEKDSEWLINYTKSYYDENNNNTAKKDLTEKESDVELIDESTYCPENCKGYAQTFLVFLHLYQHYVWHLYYENAKTNLDLKPPPSIFVKVQGKPGTGKTFVTKTLQNITRNIFQSNHRDGGSAPTGCAASLFGGKTHNRSFAIPVGKNFAKAKIFLT